MFCHSSLWRTCHFRYLSLPLWRLVLLKGTIMTSKLSQHREACLWMYYWWRLVSPLLMEILCRNANLKRFLFGQYFPQIPLGAREKGPLFIKSSNRFFRQKESAGYNASYKKEKLKCFFLFFLTLSLKLVWFTYGRTFSELVVGIIYCGRWNVNVLHWKESKK